MIEVVDVDEVGNSFVRPSRSVIEWLRRNESRSSGGAVVQRRWKGGGDVVRSNKGGSDDFAIASVPSYSAQSVDGLKTKV